MTRHFKLFCHLKLNEISTDSSRDLPRIAESPGIHSSSVQRLQKETKEIFSGSMRTNDMAYRGLGLYSSNILRNAQSIFSLQIFLYSEAFESNTMADLAKTHGFYISYGMVSFRRCAV